MKKFLHVVPARYNQVAVTIEMFCNLKTLMIEELVGQLRVAEDRFEPSTKQVTEKTVKLLLTKEEWMARNKSRTVQESSSTSSPKGGGTRYVRKDKPGARGGGDARDTGVKLTSIGTPRRRGRCNMCKIYGHYAKECKTKLKEDKQEVVHHTTGDLETGALLVAQVCTVMRTPSSGVQGVFLNQEWVFPAEYHDGTWILDTNATNHMTGCREALASLDESMHGAVRFGDGSTVEIQGIGPVAIAGRSGEHRVLTQVYFIPSLKCNIMNLGQLEQAGCRVEIENGILEVFERQQAANRQHAVLNPGGKKESALCVKGEVSISCLSVI